MMGYDPGGRSGKEWMQFGLEAFRITEDVVVLFIL